MGWARLDDHFYSHRKVLAAGNEVVGVFARSLSYAAGHENDGVIDPNMISFLTNGQPALLEALLLSGLWERDGDLIRIHDYLHFNPSARDLKKLRKANARRVRAFRERHRNGVSNGVTTPPLNLGWDGMGTKRKEQRTKRRSGEDSGASVAPFDAFWRAYPKRVSKPAARRAWEKLNPDAAVLAAILKALEWQRQLPDWTKDAGQFVPYPATYLNGRRWEDEAGETRKVGDALARSMPGLQVFATRRSAR